MGFTSDLTTMGDEGLADAWSAADVDDPAVFDTFMTEFRRREQAERLAAARKRLAEIRAEGELATHAQYLEASDRTRGRLLSREGMAASIDETDLWRLPWHQVTRFGSEEVLDFFEFVSPRITAADYVRVRAAEARMARSEAVTAAGTDLAASVEYSDAEEGSDEYDQHGAGLADDGSAALRCEPAAPQAPECAGRAVPGGGRGRAEDAEVFPAAAGARRPAGPAEPARGVSAMQAAYTSFGEIEPLRTEYLLDRYPRIPRGDVTLFFGEGSVGKGRMICSLIADVVRGGGSVITVLPEDHPAEEVAPRLRAAGVPDLSRVIDMTRLPGGSRFKLSADTKHDGDVGHLRQAIGELAEAGHDVRLVVIDPLAAVVGWGSIATNAGARRLVEPLQDLAMSTGVAVVVVAHSVKSGVLQGSAGLSQALRLVYKITKDPANPALRVLHAEKANNLVAEDLRFTVEEGDDGQVRVIWLDRAEQDRRNRSWRAAPAAAAPGSEGGQYAALVSIQGPADRRPEVLILGRYAASRQGAELARRRCEAHRLFSPGADWETAGAELLSRYELGDGTQVRFAVADLANC